jgi:hypothetical protein
MVVRDTGTFKVGMKGFSRSPISREGNGDLGIGGFTD